MRVGSAALLAMAWIGLLFLIAALTQRHARRTGGHMKGRRGAYTLALGVYCSSWTIYGAVGSAVRTGWDYLPIYLAPILLLLAAPGFLRRIARAVAEEQAVTLSDFIAARFGHDPVVARLVTLIALAGTVPYMALQFISIGIGFSIVTGEAVMVPTMITGAALLALFAMLFGARRFELTGRSEGLIYAMGLESLAKLIAMLLMAGLAVSLLVNAAPAQVAEGWAQLHRHFALRDLSADTLVIALLAGLTIFSLPRQFYMGLAEAREVEDLPRARFGFAGYLTLMAASVFPIALAGLSVLPAGTMPDYFVLTLPQQGGHTVIMAAELLGGIGAAAAMVITDATALATMVSNDLVFPSVARAAGGAQGARLAAGALGRRMLLVRRLSIFGVVMLALAWALLVRPQDSLASIGLVAFAAMAQFTPHLAMAATGRRRDPMAARASLSVGLLLWLYTLALPPILPEGWREALATGPFDPLRLLGLGHASPLVHGVVWSLGLNLLTYAVIAARKVRSAPLPALMRWHDSIADLGQLKDLVASFVGQDKALREFPEPVHGDPIDRNSAQRARQLIGAVVGTSAARSLVASALAGGRMTLGEVTHLLDERGHALGFTRPLLTATFENIDAGIRVVDEDLNLIAWNSRYESFFNYPPGMLQVGTPVEKLIRYNVNRGELGPGNPEEQVARRIAQMKQSGFYEGERYRRDGRVLKIAGGPMPGGGYVTSFTDITGEANARAELRQALAQMESRVSARTEELSQANRQLARATADKTRFLAAASHDLLQPLHAARLFTAALARDVDDHAKLLVGRVDSAITAAEVLLRALLDISKLDAGGVTPSPEPLALQPFLAGLVDGFRPMAEGKGLTLRLAPLAAEGLDVVSDPGLLRSLLQNFLANAVRYTERGGVVIGVRRRRAEDGRGWLRVDVVDTGVGIPADKVDSIFGEFTRLGDVEAEGLGLGLSLSERIARLLDARIEVSSRPGRGSRFSLWLAASSTGADGVASVTRTVPVTADVVAPDLRQRRLRVLVVDDDARTVEASVALLLSMGHRPIGAANGAEALPHAAQVDAVLVDYRLEHGEDGLSVVKRLRAIQPDLPAMLITAESGAWISELAAGMGVEMHAKPIAPEVIEQFLGQVGAVWTLPALGPSMGEIEP
ncbi:hybrid sensor histidine kinase/response regulator [Novosphingobium rosa]|uniref:hybrid sensor histidine kinase/response regulator n=1 Tax=Novosphingobium rosa TaxID=76978 RepID=UPI00082CE090|nr:PAS domain-containing hybrid sensor histidine kinase/response regulator [Novosphingobium rosa]